MAGIGGYTSGGGILGGYMANPTPGGILGGGGQSPPYANFREWMQANPDTVTALATGLLSGPTFRQSLANASAGYAQAAPMDRRRKAVNEWLKAGGPTDVQNPATAALFQSAPDLAEKYLAGKIGGVDIRRSLNPLYMTDANGNLVPGQMTDAGTIELPAMPPGMKLAPPTTYLDTGTTYTPASKYGGAAAGPPVPKNVAAAEAEKEKGAATGKAVAALPTVEAAADRMIRMLDDVLTDPYLPNVTGPIEGRAPDVTGDAARVRSKIDQIQGGTFLQAYNDLRGGGQITEKEGAAATAAYNRLSALTVNDPDYVKALQDFRAEVLKLLDVARVRAGMPPAAPASSPTPSAAPAGDGWTDLGNGVKIREKQ